MQEVLVVHFKQLSEQFAHNPVPRRKYLSFVYIINLIKNNIFTAHV